LFDLNHDFSEVNDLALTQPERLNTMIQTWWHEATRCKVLPLDDRFGPRFAENAARVQGMRRRYVFHRGVGHVPSDVAPDLRSRGYRIEADVTIPSEGADGVLIAHGDTTSGYSLYMRDSYLLHDLNVGGEHVVLKSNRAIEPGDHILSLDVTRLTRVTSPRLGVGQGQSRYTLQVDGQPVGSMESGLGFFLMIAWSGLDVGRDRGNPVGDYEAPFPFTGQLRKVTVITMDDQALDGDGVGRAEMARE
jgi:arylsulfatase